MDEFDLSKKIKEILKLFFMFGLFFDIMFVISAIIQNNITLETIKYGLSIMLFITFGIPFFWAFIYYIFHYLFKFLNPAKPIIAFNKEYVRDLPKHCSPAICSLVHDLKIDIYKDYTATVLYLCLKKYIKFTQISDTYELDLTDKKDYSNLGRCEKYVINMIKYNKEFNKYQFKAEIIKEAKEKGLIKNTYKRTEDGKKIALILTSLKNYIKDYTLLKEKEIDSIYAFEDYIPYALSLNEANVIEEFIKDNDEYRDLIYNTRKMKLL